MVWKRILAKDGALFDEDTARREKVLLGCERNEIDANRRNIDQDSRTRSTRAWAPKRMRGFLLRIAEPHSLSQHPRSLWSQTRWSSAYTTVYVTLRTHVVVFYFSGTSLPQFLGAIH